MSEPRHPISQEMLNALVDDELPSAEKGEILNRAADDPALADRICALRNLKDLVRTSYAEVASDCAKHENKVKRTPWSTIAAAIVIAMTGTVFGWYLHPESTKPDQIVLLDPEGTSRQATSEHEKETRIVFHLTDPDMTTAAELLNEVEGVLDHYRQRQLSLKVEVVAHGEGLGLLRTRLSVHKQRIATLSRTYPNLTFVACQNSIRRLQVEKGEEVTLIPEAMLTDSGVAHVVHRQQQGWLYIQV